jgi:hypothetical protein
MCVCAYVRTKHGHGASGAASTRVGVLFGAKHGAFVVDVAFRVTEVVVGVIVVDALVELPFTVAIATQRLQLLPPKCLDPCWCLRWQVRLQHTALHC